MNWAPIRVESELDREKLAGILARNDYEVRIAKVKNKNRYERYVECRERELERKEEEG